MLAIFRKTVETKTDTNRNGFQVFKICIGILISKNSLTDLKGMSLVMRKLAYCICENKDADQLRGNREAEQRLCFRYIASTIPLLPKYKISSL